jgi:Fe2+ transport system protein FeoA
MISRPIIDQSIPLSKLGLNQTAEVVRLEGDEACRHRVEEMGLRAGASVRMLRCDIPHIVAIDGRRVSFRFNDSLQIWVRPFESNSASRSLNR